VPGHTRRWWVTRAAALVVAWAALTALVAAVGTWVEHSSTVNGFDRHVTSVVVAHRSPALDDVMKAVTWLGSWVALAVMGAVIVVLTVRGRLPVLALVLAVVAWGGETSGVTLGKHLVQRPRPPQRLWLVHTHGWSWPSGHAAVASVVFAAGALVVMLVTTSRPARIIAWAAAAVAVALVAFSRIELGVHWATDVGASVVFVSGWLAVLAVLFSPVRPAAPGRAAVVGVAPAGSPRREGE
jgi:undecaprenyl-diphosphatase